MKFHIIVEANNPPEKIAELAQLAESYGMVGIWTSNMHDSRDPFINFVDAARATKTIRLGPVAVSPYELHPLKMANAVLTLNEISSGRAHIGVGAGDGGTATAMGMKAVRRVRAARECVEIIEAAGTGEPVQYKGEMYNVMYYHSSWVTQQPPDVFVCAGGPQMIASSARYAQGIFVGDHLPEHVAAVNKVIKKEQAAIGRKDENFRLLNFWPVNASADIHAVVSAGVDDFSAIAPLLSRFAGLENPAGGITAAFTVEGTLGEPNVRGQATLANGSVELPVAGIELTAINLDLTGQGVKPLQVSGSAMSGGGQVNVAGQIDWLAADDSAVRLHITGNRFQVVRFPLQTVYASPDLRLRITDELIEVTGRIEVPQANIEFDELPKTAVSPSSDIVVIREETPVKKRRGGLPLVATMEVLLGKDVRFAAFGLDTELRGSLRLQTTLSEPEFAAEGNLRSVKGKFEAYGRELEIERGNLIFSGVIDNPRVDVLAVRALRYDGQDIKVGVLLTGPIDAMQTRVFGEPAMNESDALAYLVMNRPMRRTDNMASEELSSAAVALGLVNMLPVTQQLSSSLGLDEVGVEGMTESNSSVVAGKQFGEDFYIRYSYGLFDRIGTFIVRYNIGSGFSLEAGSGQEQTINMLYSIDR